MADPASFLKRLARAKEAIQTSGMTRSIVLHHDEADGLSSGALTKLALERLGLDTRLICIDKLYPEVVQDVQGGIQKVLAYSDVGSAHMDLLIDRNRSGSIILTLDHHDTSTLENPSVHNLNPELDGFSGEKDASSATVAYLFAKTVDPSLTEFAHLALIGSTEIPGETKGLNSIPLEDAESSRLVNKTPKGGLRIEKSGVSLSLSRASTTLNVLGSVGYYRDGPQLGVEACIKGFNEKTLRLAQELEEERKTANQRMLEAIRRDGLSQLKMVQWFHARDNYVGMSGKVVGSFCSYLSYQRLVNPMKYLVGMMNVPPEIPGWGKLHSSMVKVSARAPRLLAGLIDRGAKPSLARILPIACEKAGGFGDGHSVAASGVFPLGAENLFLDEMEELIGDLGPTGTRRPSEPAPA